MKLLFGNAAIAAIVAVMGMQAHSAANAQVPPHRAGEICITPKLWCWQKPPGKKGAVCTCRTPYGLVKGKLG